MSAIDELTGYLGSFVRIKISDDRVIKGEFQCIDKDKNFILGDAVEYHLKGGDMDTENVDLHSTASTRILGLVMIPGKHVVKCELLRN